MKPGYALTRILLMQCCAVELLVHLLFDLAIIRRFYIYNVCYHPSILTIFFPKKIPSPQEWKKANSLGFAALHCVRQKGQYYLKKNLSKTFLPHHQNRTSISVAVKAKFADIASATGAASPLCGDSYPEQME